MRLSLLMLAALVPAAPAFAAETPELQRAVGAPQAVGAVHTLRQIPRPARGWKVRSPVMPPRHIASPPSGPASNASHARASSITPRRSRVPTRAGSSMM